jgi:hypothetical protein
MIIGNIDEVKILQIFDCGKKIKTNQKGNTPRFNQK